MDGVKPLTDAQLAEMLDDPDGNYTHPGVEAAERIASMVAEIRMHRAAAAVESPAPTPDPEAVIQRAHDLVKAREVARLEGLRAKDDE